MNRRDPFPTRTLTDRQFVLATDLDGTFLGGSAGARDLSILVRLHAGHAHGSDHLAADNDGHTAFQHARQDRRGQEGVATGVDARRI